MFDCPVLVIAWLASATQSNKRLSTVSAFAFNLMKAALGARAACQGGCLPFKVKKQTVGTPGMLLMVVGEKIENPEALGFCLPVYFD